MNVNTPLRLDPCGCTLEEGDEGRPLFVSCRTHWTGRKMLAALRQAHTTVSDTLGIDHPTARLIYDTIQEATQ